MARGEGLHERPLVHEVPAAGVGKVGAVPHGVKEGLVGDACRLGRAGQNRADHVGLGKEPRQVGEGAHVIEWVVRGGLARADATDRGSHGGKETRQVGSDVPGAQHQHAGASEGGDGAQVVPVMRALAVLVGGQALDQREDHGKEVLGDRLAVGTGGAAQGAAVRKHAGGGVLFVAGGVELQQAQAGRELAKKTFDRVKALYEQGVVPAQKFDEAQAQYNAMTATAAAAKAQYDLAVDGASKEEKAAAAAQVRQAAGVVSEVESYLSDAMVYSPVTGEISTIIAEQGELVGSGYPVVAILDMSDMWVTFNIKETLMPKIRMGKRLRGYVPALDRDVDFHITYIAPQADFATWAATRTQGGFDIRTFAVKAKPLGAEEGIRPGMSVLVDWDAIE